MKNKWLACCGLILASALFLASCNRNGSLTSLVNPFVGTDGHGHTFPGAIVPFGMIQPGPDTRLEGWDGCSGYHYSDDTIYGFSHTHLSGTGCEDLCDLLLMPVDKSFSSSDGKLSNLDYCSHFSHSRESARPGYYSVLLDRNRTKVELTCNERTACHRYSFPNSDGNGFIIDLQHRDKLLSGHLELRGDLIVGHRFSASWNPNQKLFFAIKTCSPISSIEILNDSTQAVVRFADNTSEASLWVAISAVDIEGAIANLQSQPLLSFDEMRAAADSIWEQQLSKINVSGGTNEQRRNFYTALYHCCTSPYLFSDADGRYRGQDDQIHQAEDNHNIYTVFSLWDTYRALHPLLTIIEPERTEDFIYTFLKHYEQGGELTMWELAAHETHCMIGYHAAPVILEAATAGLLDQWTESQKAKLLEGMIVTSNLQSYGRKAYGEQGYLSSEVDNESVSKTLEYAYDDWCIAQYANTIGTGNDIIDTYLRRSNSWRNLMDTNGFMHARRNGGFVTPFDPTEINNHYTEGNSWQYSTYVPHNVTGWIEAIGGPEKAELFLDSLFNSSSKLSGRDQVDVTGLIGQYAHGNEPSHHAAYLYTYLGKPEKTQKLINTILATLYSSKPDGLCGNEDCGQMSAWYVLSAMGLYPVCPGSGEFVTVKPLFKEISVCNNALVINKNTWQHGCFYNRLANKFNTTPYQHRTLPYISAPCFNTWQQRFDSVATISITSPDNADIFYTINGNDPDTNSTKYTGPFTIDRDATVKAVATFYTVSCDNRQLLPIYSSTVAHTLTRFSSDKKLSYITKPDPQYYENGEEGLIDRLHGQLNYRIGGWQGWTTDMEVLIDLLSVKKIHSVGVSCLENTRSWIFYPKAIAVCHSTDGKNFTPYNIVSTNYKPVASAAGTTGLKTFSVPAPVSARYLKVKAVNFGKMPKWHISAGEQSWLFIDEIEIQ